MALSGDTPKARRNPLGPALPHHLSPLSTSPHTPRPCRQSRIESSELRERLREAQQDAARQAHNVQSLASRAEAEHEGAAAQMAAMRARVQGEAWRVPLAAISTPRAARSSALSSSLAAAGSVLGVGCCCRPCRPTRCSREALQKLSELHLELQEHSN